MPEKETMMEAGYKYVRFAPEFGGHILRNIRQNKLELFFANKGHASWGIRWRNTDLEFARGVESKGGSH